MSQTLLRVRLGRGVIHPKLDQIADAVVAISKIMHITTACDENDAILELARRYEIAVEIDRSGEVVAV